MRSYVPAYELIAPKNLEHALSLIGEEWKPFAGGTDLMVLFEAGKLPHKKYVSIWGLAELRGIAVSPEYVTLGALTTYTQVQRDPVLRREFPLLVQAASETGGVATPESRDAGRQYRQRVAGCGFSSGAAGLRRGTRADLEIGLALGSVCDVPYRVQADDPASG